nr:BEN [Cotesia vestalis bracovirus]
MAFYVVQFLELPYKGIDDYVCVPHTWVIVRRRQDGKSVIAYPEDRDPAVTRDRAKRKERCRDDWNFYVADVIYQSNSYQNAEFWIARSNHRPLVERIADNLVERETRRMPDTQPESNTDPRNSTQGHSSKLNDNLRKPLPRILIKRPAQLELNKQLHEKRSKLNETAQSSSASVTTLIQKSAVASNISLRTEQRPQIQRTEQNKEALSLPVIDVDGPPEVMEIDDRHHSQGIKTSNQISLSNSKTQLENVQSHVNAHNDHERRESSNLIDQTGSSSAPSVEEQSSVVAQTRSQDGLQVREMHPEKSKDQTGSLQEITIDSPEIKHALKRNAESASDTPLASQNLQSSSDISSNPLYQTSNFPQQRPSQPNEQDLQRQPQIPKIRTSFSNELQNERQMPTLRGVKNKVQPSAMSNLLDSIRLTLSATHNEYLRNEQQLQARVSGQSGQSTVHNNAALTSSLKNITISDTVIDNARQTGECMFHDRPTAAQNSTSMNPTTNVRSTLEQQMLDNFAVLFTQMGSTLRYTFEEFNSTQNSTGNESFSIHLKPEVRQSPEERHTEVTANTSSSTQDQQSNGIVNNPPKVKHNSWRFVLPPEYDPHDTRWTLKYRTNLPGLVELMPQSGVYISYGDLIYCQQVSKDCKSLACRLLLAVFNRKALSVCSTITEKAHASDHVGSDKRPELDNHACTVLLHFVLKHGVERGWNTDLHLILSILHSVQIVVILIYVPDRSGLERHLLGMLKQRSKRISDRDTRSINGAYIEQSMNRYVNTGPPESNHVFSDGQQHIHITGDIRGAVINQTTNEYRVGRNGGSIQAATITQTGNREFSIDKNDGKNSQAENYDKDNSLNSKELPTISTSEVKANRVVLQPKNQLPQLNNGTENISSTPFPQPPQSETANHLYDNYNYQEMRSRQLQTPQETQYLPSQSGFLPTKFKSGNYPNINYNYNGQGFVQLQTPQGTQYLPSQSGFLPTKFKNFNYPNSTYNYNGQGFGQFQTPQEIQYLASTSGFRPPQPVNINYSNANYDYYGQLLRGLQSLQGSQFFFPQSGMPPTQFENGNYRNSNYNYNGQGFGQLQTPQETPFYQGQRFRPPLTRQEAESLRSQSGLQSSLPTTTNVPSDQGKSFERNYQPSQNDLSGFYPSQHSPIQQTNNRQPLASSSANIDAQAHSQATGVTSTPSVVNPADMFRLAAIPEGYVLVCDPLKGFCSFQPRQQDMKNNIRTQ